ncbi:MAG: C4-dicarboxylate ABC transporter substrate-binding protein, partial [Gemmobacter sp.]|nr:C4-dicarboxylate ABC transporter substrate-binding protein [Gemmobacter sp.]
DRAILMEEFRTGGQQLTKTSADLEGEIRKEFESKGVTFHEADIEAYRAATAGFFSSFPAWPTGLYDQVRAAASGN